MHTGKSQSPLQDIQHANQDHVLPHIEQVLQERCVHIVAQTTTEERERIRKDVMDIKSGKNSEFVSLSKAKK